MGGECDVLVIGGGPGGSTAAAFLAMRGHDVVLLEKDRHPRFHVGESLLPVNTAIFERLGIREAVASLGVEKPGAEFVSDRSGRAVQFSFAEGLDKRYTSSWQVRRAEFDALLLQTARERGARAHESTRVTQARFGRPGARAEIEAVGADGEGSTWRPRYVIDASGRDTFLAGRYRRTTRNKRTNSAAVYGHFRGAIRRTGALEGYISIHLADDGWFWMIPLHDDVMSVGFVGNPAAFKSRPTEAGLEGKSRPTEAGLEGKSRPVGGGLEGTFRARIAASPTVTERLAGAEMISGPTGSGNYSYRADRSYGDGYLMIGDAFGFIDPIFSSGVYLAMAGGERGADVAEAALRDPAQGRRAAARMEREVRQGMDRLAWLIYRINEPALRILFMNPANGMRMRDGLVSLLAGNLRPVRGQTLPVLAFKSAYYIATAMQRAGFLREPALG